MPDSLPIGEIVVNWSVPPVPTDPVLVGRYARVERLKMEHAPALFANNALDVDGLNWTYMGYGPFATLADYEAWVADAIAKSDPLFCAFIDESNGEPVGVGSFMRIDPSAGAIEIGHLVFSPKMQRTRISTETISLMIDHCFELGYRRCEWKCNSLNAASNKAAQRFGFTYEGLFRQATITKGRNRDTTWYSILDKEWPAIKVEHDRWLDPSNFDDAGNQRTPLTIAR